MWYLSGMNVMHYGSMNYCISLTQVFCPIPWDQFIPDGHLLTFNTTKSNTTTRMKSFKSSGIHCFLFVSREYTSAYCLVSLLIRRWRLVPIKWRNWIPFTVNINVAVAHKHAITKFYVDILLCFSFFGRSCYLDHTWTLLLNFAYQTFVSYRWIDGRPQYSLSFPCLPVKENQLWNK